MKELSGTKLLIIAVVCGLVAALLTVLYLKQQEARYRNAYQPEKQTMVAVVVPKRDLVTSTPLSPDNVAAREIPEQYVPANAVLASQWQQIEGRTVVMDLKRGSLLTWNALEQNVTRTFSENVALGKRGYTLKVNKVNSFDGLLRPGDHIDILGNFSAEDLGISVGTDNTDDTIIVPILQDVVVLAAGREDLNRKKWEVYYDQSTVDGFNMNFTTVTLQLTPRQAARLELANNTAQLAAVLRHPKDTSLSQMEYVSMQALLEDDPPQPVDVVLDENGNPVGRVIGDNVVDENGNIIGKVVDGKAVTFDGKELGSIAKGVSEDDPLLRVKETADVVRDADGNIIGKIVDGQVVDKNGNVIGRVDENGNAVGLDGQRLGTVERNVALDANGNEVDLSGSAAAASRGQVREVVRDADGNIIGYVEDGKVVDKDGKVIGTVNDQGEAVGLDGQSLGEVETAVVDSQGRVVAETAEVVRDANGNIIGRVVDGKVVDKDGNVIGEVNDNGEAVGLDGQSLGSVDTALVDENGNVVETAQVVRDADGNIIGRVVDGKVVDADGNVLGTVVNGKVVDADGNVIADNVNVTTENAAAVAAEERAVQEARTATPSNFVDFIAGGTAKDGVINVQRLRLE